MEICIWLGFAVKQMKWGKIISPPLDCSIFPPNIRELFGNESNKKNKYSDLCNFFLDRQGTSTYSAAPCLKLWPTDGTIDQDTLVHTTSATTDLFFCFSEILYNSV